MPCVMMSRPPFCLVPFRWGDGESVDPFTSLNTIGDSMHNQPDVLGEGISLFFALIIMI